MSISLETPQLPQWDMADRMRKTIREDGTTVKDVAAYFQVSPNTIGNWINGNTTPRMRDLRLWAFRFAVPLDWLIHGDDVQRMGYTTDRAAAA